MNKKKQKEAEKLIGSLGIIGFTVYSMFKLKKGEKLVLKEKRKVIEIKRVK